MFIGDIFLGAVLKTSYFFQNIFNVMHKVNAELFVKNRTCFCYSVTLQCCIRKQLIGIGN